MKNKNFEDLPITPHIEFEHFLFLLKQGREFEFFYNNKKYFIPNYKERRVLLAEEGENLTPYIKNEEEFVEKPKIDGLTLTKLFQNQND
ncbi:hypothetical protein [Virgibacillus proomii]|uniref:hypothetical protein n=1 Tax=Virgibacillus proomii TaxID=84407 RepID=UPI001C105C3E|nr:hypothetical protein [Virgibacillus proomii]MBU5266550.1 hypothetical protein [Virgibacillus proomii]